LISDVVLVPAFHLCPYLVRQWQVAPSPHACNLRPHGTRPIL